MALEGPNLLFIQYNHDHLFNLSDLVALLRHLGQEGQVVHGGHFGLEILIGPLSKIFIFY